VTVTVSNYKAEKLSLLEAIKKDIKSDNYACIAMGRGLSTEESDSEALPVELVLGQIGAVVAQWNLTDVLIVSTPHAQDRSE